MKIIDGPITRIVENEEKTDELKNKSWRNYIVGFNKINKNEHNQTEITKHMDIKDIEVWQRGGKTKLTIAHWNIQSLKLKNKSSLKEFRRIVNPDILHIN